MSVSSTPRDVTGSLRSGGGIGNHLKREVLTRNLMVDGALLTRQNDDTLEGVRISRSPPATMVLNVTDPAGQDYRKTRRKDIADPR